MADGWITIGTELATDKFDKQIIELEKKMKKEEDKKVLVQTKLNIQQEELEKARAKTDELGDAYQRLAQLKEQVNKTPLEFSEMQGLQNQYGTLEKIDSKLQQAISKQDAIDLATQRTKAQYDGINQKVDEYKRKIEGIKLQKQTTEVSKLNNGLKSTGNHLENAIRKVGRLVLGIFSIRSAYMAVSRASSYLATYNEGYATNLEYIRYALTQAIAPVLMWIVQMAAKLLGFINAIWKYLFGVSLFANGSADSFNKMKAGASGVSKAVKEIRKQLTGFDEINMLSEQSDTGTSAGAGGVGIPSINFEDVELPEWLSNIIDWFKPLIDFFKKIEEEQGPVVAAIVGIIGALGGFIILKTLISWFKGLGKQTKSVGTDFTKFFDRLGFAFEIIAILGGLALVLAQVTELIKAFAESGLKLSDVAQLLGIVLGELVLAFVAIAAATKLMNWTGVAAAAVVLGGLAIVIVTVTNLIKEFSKSGMELSDVAKLLGAILLEVVIAMTALAVIAMLLSSNPLALLGVLALVIAISAILLVIAETLPKILDACAKFINSIAPSIISLIRTINECIDNTIRALGEVLPPIIKSLGDLFNSIFNGISDVVTSVGNAVSNIINSIGNVIMSVFTGIRDIIRQIGDTITQVATTIIWFINNIGPAIENFSNSLIRTVTRIVNFVVSAVEYLINRVVDGINELSNILGTVGINIGTRNHVYIPRFYPALKTGGIVNMPNTGTLVGGAIAGESGREGVIPLTDQQAMSELGREIGKNVLINLTNITTMNGRTISREIKQVQSEQDFAYNA